MALSHVAEQIKALYWQTTKDDHGMDVLAQGFTGQADFTESS